MADSSAPKANRAISTSAGSMVCQKGSILAPSRTTERFRTGSHSIKL